MILTKEEKQTCLNIIEAYGQLSDKLANLKKSLIEIRSNLTSDRIQEYLDLKKESDETIEKLNTIMQADKDMEDFLMKKYPELNANNLRLELYEHLSY